MKLAIAQVAPTLGDLQGNLDQTRRVVEQATKAGAELVVFPELNLSGYLVGDTDELPALSATDQRLRTATATAGRGAVLVGFPETDGDHLFNSAALFAGGRLQHVHRKLILPTYGPFTERKHFAPGDALRAFDTPLGRAVILLCEDVVQPAFATIAAHDGAKLLLMPANSAHSLLPEVNNRAHWRAVTSFYARLTQSFVVFVNRVGHEGPFRFEGGSHVLQPTGQLLAEAPYDDEALLVVEFDLDDVARHRRTVPLLSDPRLDVVRDELQRIAHAPAAPHIAAVS